jgi:hypothetical protein
MEFRRDTITAELAAASCKRCGRIGGKFESVFDQGSPQFARVDCRACGAFIDWVKFPDAPLKTDRRKSWKKLRVLGDRCEICLRQQDDRMHAGAIVRGVIGVRDGAAFGWRARPCDRT